MRRGSFRCLLVGAAVGTGLLISPDAKAYTIISLASFNGSNGAAPLAGVISDAAGNLYGTTSDGGANSIGAVFELPVGTHTINALASFSSNGNPQAGVILDSSGNLYGTTLGQPALSQNGSVFEVAAVTHNLTTLAAFNGTNGANPFGGLVADPSGNMFGSTEAGGTNSDGTIFEIDATTHALSTISTFNGGNGASPIGALITDAGGNLYGVTSAGTVSAVHGTVFKINASNHSIVTLANIGSSGLAPSSGLVADSSGNLYGTTRFGGTGSDGTVFEVAANTNVLSTLYSFSGTDGSSPEGSLILDSNGNLYGTTISGGLNNKGTVFELNPNTDALTTLVSFNGTNGSAPFGNLLPDSTGDFFGTTGGGGASGNGTIFEVVVPEPACLSMLCVATLGLFTRRQRRSHQSA